MEEDKKYGPHTCHGLDDSYCGLVVQNIVQACTDVLETHTENSCRMCLLDSQTQHNQNTRCHNSQVCNIKNVIFVDLGTGMTQSV